MIGPPGERGRLTPEATPHKAANQDRETTIRVGGECVESVVAQLNLSQALTYGAAWLTASRGLTAPSNKELLELTGFQSDAQPNRLYRQLEKRGYLIARGFQRGRQIVVIALGKATAAPRCQSPHWKHREKTRG